jgi:PKD repeat protein
MNQKKAPIRIRSLSYRSLVCILAFMWVLQALVASAHIIHVEWSYSGSAVSYILYENGAQVCTSADPSLLQMDCDIFLEDTPMVFTLSAVDAAGVHSPQSSPYTLTPPPKDATGNYIPQADIAASVTSGDAPLSVNFDASAASDIDGTIVNYDWDFGDGEIGTGSLIDHIFTDPGVYATTLTVIDDSGASSAKVISITVTDLNASIAPANEPPSAIITATPMQSGTSDIAFDAYSSSDVDGTITSYSWNFGDGDTATGDYAEHKYLATGDYTVVLTIVDDQGASSQDSMTVSIVDQVPANTPPVSIISASLEQHLLHFNWDYTADPNLAGFRFYQDSALVCDIADPAARQADCLAYIDSGQVQMWLSAYDLAGVEVDSQIFSFDAGGIFDAPVSGDAPLSVHLSGGAYYDPDGSIATFAWDFGDGAVASDQAVDHVFTSPGVYTVTLAVTDDAGDVTKSTSEITVTGVVNTPPTVQPASFTTLQDKSVSGTLTGSDAEGDPLIFSIVANGSKGVVTITNTATGVFTYVPTAGQYGTDAFVFKANDGHNDSSAATVSVDIQKVNQAPVANTQNITLSEDNAFNGSLTGSDADGDSLAYSIVTNGSKGTAVINDPASGSFTYSPQKNANGTDSFTFKANDGKLDSAAVTVNVNISPVNDAPVAEPLSVSVDEDSPLNGSLRAADVDADQLSFSMTTPPTSGETVINADGSFIYTPTADFNGADSFSYKVSDGALESSAAVKVTVNPINDAPVAQDDTAETEVDQAVTIDVMANDSDVDGDTLSITQVNGAAHGIVAVNGTKIIYTPAASYIGSDSFNYTVNDAQLSSSAAVTITVTPPQYLITMSWEYDAATPVNGFRLYYNGVAICETADPVARQLVCKIPVSDEAKAFSLTALDANGGESAVSNTLTYDPAMWNHAPTAQDVSLQTTEDTALSAVLPALDSDGDALTYTLQSNGIKGLAEITDPVSGAFTYTPQANISGTDSFTFTVSDGKKDSAITTATITITPVNDAPVATPQAITVVEDGTANGKLTATDIDGDALTYSLVTNGGKGTATITDAASGSFNYVPQVDANGADSFSYKASDGKLDSAVVTVDVNITPVNDAPVAESTSVVTNEDSSVTGNLQATDIDSTALTFTLSGNAANGVALINGDGSYTYTPNGDFNGNDSFSYSVSDGALAAKATVKVTVNAVNDAPVALDDSLTITEDSKVGIDVLVNDTDVDGDTLQLASLGNPVHGSVVLNNNQAVYTPNTNYNGVDNFTYSVSDGKGGAATGKVNIILTAVNDAPVAVDDQANAEGTIPVTIDLLANDTDVDGDTLSVASVEQPISGQVSLSANGQAVYTAKPKFVGTDTFAYTISDNHGGTTTAVASVVVIPPQQTITYSWDYTADTTNLAGFKLYRNDVVICETSDKNARTLTCKAPIIDGPLTFALRAVDTSGAETALSNTISYNAQPATLDVSFAWDYDSNVQPAAGFKIYMNGAVICESADPAARQLTCQIPKEDGPKTFYLTVVDANGVESTPSNSMTSP